MEKLGGRKTVMALICLIAGVAIDLTTNRGLSQNLLYLMMFIVGAYSTANVVNKGVVGRAIQNDEDKASNLDIVKGQLYDMSDRQQQLEQYISGTLSQVEAIQKQVELSNKKISALFEVAKQ